MTEFKVSVSYLGALNFTRDYDVKAGDARIAAQHALKRFTKADSYVGPLYRKLALRTGQSLTVVVTR